MEFYLHSPYDFVPCTGADLDLGILGFTNLMIATGSYKSRIVNSRSTDDLEDLGVDGM